MGSDMTDVMDVTEAVRFEACEGFRASGEDEFVCSCGWLEEDHGELAAARVARDRRRPRPIVTPERRAS